MPKMEKTEDSRNSTCPLRLTRRRGTKKIMPSILIRCGCCNERLEIYLERTPTGNPNSDILEINGVVGTVDQWKQVLLPLLGV
jgi:hypothetical protein